MKNNYLIAVIGPTAIGKTALSIQLAKHFGCEIISSDSRQFFSEMNIGTAVPSAAELAAAKHHFIHNKSIFDSYTVGDFEKEAILKLDELFKTNDFAVMVGGSGLYTDAILNGFDAFPEIENAVREQIRKDYEQKGIGYLQTELQRLDPFYFNSLSGENSQTLLNPQRMMRFVEVCTGAGKPYSSFLNRKKSRRNFTPVIIGLQAERQVMYDRIDLRTDLMMEAGLLAEAGKLYPYKNLNALQTVGYREIFQYLEGAFALDFAVAQIKKNTRRFAKRQMTWFKKTENVQWFDYQTDVMEIVRCIESTLNFKLFRSLMPIAENFASVFSKDWEINFTQCTPNGYLKYTDLCNILQLTAGDHAESGGISFSDMQEFHQAWVLSRMRVEILALPKWRDTVTVKTWIVSLENSRSVRALEMYVNGEKAVGSETFWAVFNTKMRRPEALALPHGHFAKYPENISTLERVKKIGISDAFIILENRSVVLSDLDIVNHVNNVKYLEWCLDIVDPKLVLKQRLQSFDMNFMKELTLNEEVSILESKLETRSIYSIEKNGAACFALELNWK